MTKPASQIVYRCDYTPGVWTYWTYSESGAKLMLNVKEYTNLVTHGAKEHTVA